MTPSPDNLAPRNPEGLLRSPERAFGLSPEKGKSKFINDLSKKILREIQANFPISSYPYKVLGERLKLSEEEIWSRIKALRKEGIISRIAASINSRRLSLVSTLVAMKVAKDSLDRVASIISEYEGVSHNYARDDEYNLWFTLMARREEELNHLLEEIKKRTGESNLLNLPAVEVFKINVVFDFR